MQPTPRSCRAALKFGLLLVASGAVSAAPVVIDFDDLPADQFIGYGPGICAGDHYAGSGVLLRTAIVRGSAQVGAVIMLTDVVDEFEVLGGWGQPAISLPNLAIPRSGGGENDLLMIFTTPVTRVSITSDDYSPETPEAIRLLALAPTAAADAFLVLAVDQKMDDAVAPPDNRLSVDRGGVPFSVALFEITSEQEGFDDLTFLQAISAKVDIRPQSCPNPFNARSRGELPVAILGSTDLDVRSIDAASVRLGGVAPLRDSSKDVGGAPVGEPACGCAPDGPDGQMDRIFHFPDEAVIAALGPLADGEIKELIVTGSFLDGTPFYGTDCVVLRNPIHPRRP